MTVMYLAALHHSGHAPLCLNLLNKIKSSHEATQVGNTPNPSAAQACTIEKLPTFRVHKYSHRNKAMGNNALSLTFHAFYAQCKEGAFGTKKLSAWLCIARKSCLLSIYNI